LAPASPPAASPAAVIEAHLPISSIVAEAPAPDGVWYVTATGDAGSVGRATVGGSVLEKPAGPAPVAITSANRAAFVLEGRPTLEPVERARVDVVERLDPDTLSVSASAPTGGLATDMVVAGDEVWAIRTDGVLRVFDAASLVLRGDIRVEGRGPAQLASTGGEVWALIGKTDDQGGGSLLLHRIDAGGRTVISTTLISARPTIAAMASGDRPWLGLSRDTDTGFVAAVDAAGKLEAGVELPVRTPVALAVGASHVWWLSADGQLGAIDASTGIPVGKLRVGSGGSALAVSGGLVWAATDDLVVLGPAG
jgi:hypothetical protein